MKISEEQLIDLKFNADCAIDDPESIYGVEFFLCIDELFGKQGNYSEPVQAVAISALAGEIIRLRGLISSAGVEL